MAPIDALREVALSPAHLSAALALSAEAGWNQTGDDWRLMIRHGRAIGLEAPGGRLVASALALPYGGRFAWISMVLVTADWRRKGLASRLMRSCIDWLLGRSATQIGPIVADGPRTAVALLAAALAAAPPGPVFIDVPDAQGCMLGYLERSGFRLQRPYTRMIHRRAEPFGDPGRTHAIAGPELG